MAGINEEDGKNTKRLSCSYFDFLTILYTRIFFPIDLPTHKYNINNILLKGIAFPAIIMHSSCLTRSHAYVLLAPTFQPLFFRHHFTNLN